MEIVSKFKISESEKFIIAKTEKFKGQVDLDEYLEVNHYIIKLWIKEYKESGYDAMIKPKNKGNYKERISTPLHKILELTVKGSNNLLIRLFVRCKLG
ncbi:hypothetical protein [Tenacibaculum maritimum]|uniref:hypothetical protein n=1 Tax=Tenacibaculum maritimum TaxID=107401 RepID=UPI001331078C|nr:hypothetical protein [Tenacibaculum maritimum]MCD9582203.1 hypothetical protein [Tenacibaculum maritimum]MCD9636582.1 hypothetical protein [Tenacibaculum maritimum]